MNQSDLLSIYQQKPQISELSKALNQSTAPKVHIPDLKGSSKALVLAAIYSNVRKNFMIILPDKEAAMYFADDFETFTSDKKCLFYPSPFKKDKDFSLLDSQAQLTRTETLDRLKKLHTHAVVVTYPEALCEKVLSREELKLNTFEVQIGENLDMDFAIDFLIDYGFERTEFVYQPGTFSVRGGILDIFSFAYELPYRIELDGDSVESIRAFDPESQLSMRKMHSITIIPNLEEQEIKEERISLLEYMGENTIVASFDMQYVVDAMKAFLKMAKKAISENENLFLGKPDEILENATRFKKLIDKHPHIELGPKPFYGEAELLTMPNQPQPFFHKNFNMLADNLEQNRKNGIKTFIFSDQPRQIERIYAIFEDLQRPVEFIAIFKSLNDGFIDTDAKLALYSEHQIFDRYHKAKRKKSASGTNALTLKELYELKPGDFITHIDHGIGVYSGLEKIEVNNKVQEAVRLVYKDGDLLYVNIHSLHKISRFVGKEGKPPKVYKLGSNAWETVKSRTKKKVKDIARDLIKLYAQRKAQQGFAFSPDTYLQTELEASFIYEDTPDQAKSTEDVKKDMEQEAPMDRLVCGDVGFGKTEVAIRAAFKAVADSKQVAVLVPTTVLAMQHAKTFTERLKDFPCRVEYISRFKTTKQIKEILAETEKGRVDILIGTHRILSKDVKFRDLGLLVIDEEQKFGVAAKEKIRQMKVNVDTLTLTATPIPRTLQFSLMGARDLSVINTPPPNRQPIETTVVVYSEEVIKEAVENELARAGQVFFVHNRIKDIFQVADKIRALVPYAKVTVAHGQMDAKQLEESMLAFVDGYFDVLVSTSIIESGLDISNANTIIVNQAHNFGLSDLYQMRGRVGRSNKKAYAWLITPPKTMLTSDARKRLSAIEEFSELGSGFHIAMRDLDIRGAGDLLGGEQSGFIAEVGFEMFQKILDEAIHELKEDEFADVFPEEQEKRFTTRDCQIDTDLELLIPDKYISSVNERLIIYNDMNRLKNEEGLKKFEADLIDRFGPIPRQTRELLDAMRMKWMAQEVGIEKITLHKNKLKAHFAAKSESGFFQSDRFGRILNYVQRHPDLTKFEQKGEQLQLHIRNTRSIKEALVIFERLLRQE